MNAPLTIKINDAAQRKAALWDALREFSSDEMRIIDQALTHYAQTRHLEATEKRSDQQRALNNNDAIAAAQFGLESGVLRRKAADIRDLQDKITQADNLSYLPMGD